MGEALKSNTTLTELNLDSKTKERRHKTFINNSPFSVLFIQKANYIGETGATSLSEALKSNTTLKRLNLGSEDKRKRTHKKIIHLQFTLPFSSTANEIGNTGAISLSETLKSNTTLTKLKLESENQRQKIQNGTYLNK